MHREGADLAFTYQNDRLKDRVVDMAAECNSSAVFPCDVEHDQEIEALAASLKDHWGSLDILVHAVGFAPRDQLEGDYLDNVTREGFRIAHDISSYSFAALGKACNGPSGVRVNAISAGPIRTLAASGISDFKKLLTYVADSSPLKRNVTIEQVGDTAAFLCSDMAAGITGQTVYVDNGFNNVAMPPSME